MTRRTLTKALLLASPLPAWSRDLPFSTVFKGEARFRALVARTTPLAAQLQAMPIGQRAAYLGQMLVGTPYKSYTLEIDDHIEAVSVNFDGLDCWTFFETALAYARMTAHKPAEWSPQLLLRYIETDRYWKGKCTGSYLSRLHYLEDWADENDRRGLVTALTRKLGGTGFTNAATEMTNGWKGYRYMVNSASNREGIAKLEARLRSQPLYMIPKAKVTTVEPLLQNGDIIGIVSRHGSAYGTSHVGMALRQGSTLHFMHASSPRNAGKVLIDSRLSDYLNRYNTHAGILVARPVK
jgi:hypothetical protein